MLTELVDDDARKAVHLGVTSQDIIDTATMLQIREGVDLLIGRLLDIAQTCGTLAERHRHTPMAGRTLLQHAVPVTFGLKAARWLALSTRLATRLRTLQQQVVVVQLGGAAGTLAALGKEGLRVMEMLAHDLGLGVPDLPWHAERDRIGEVAAGLGVVAGAMGSLQVDADRMQANLNLTHGLIMAEALTTALVPHLGRSEAFRAVQRVSDRAAQTRTNLRDVAAADAQIRAVLSPQALERVFDVSAYLGSTDTFIDRALADFRSMRPQAPAR